MERVLGDFHCQVCDRDFPRLNLPGNHKNRRRICDGCREWHKWCQCCARPRLLSEFAKSAHHGKQPYCNECLVQTRGNIKIRECFSCSQEFMVRNSTRYNGRSEWMCANCSASKKLCKRCGSVRPHTDFARAKDKAHGLAAHCRSCTADKWRERPPQERHRARERKFGLTFDEYESMARSQGNLCAICKSAEKDRYRRNGERIRGLAIDHDHVTGAVRSLLCGKCNRAIGLMLDNPDRLRAAADYLDRFAAE